MNKFLKLTLNIIIGTMLISSGFIGCSPKISEEESTKLQEAKEAAISAEKKLSELRMERKSLEEQYGANEGNVEEQTQDSPQELSAEEQQQEDEEEITE